MMAPAYCGVSVLGASATFDASGNIAAATDAAEEVGAVVWREGQMAAKPFDAFNAPRRVDG